MSSVMKSGLVYHYTDTARLPWILRSRELVADKNGLGGFPNPDFLWATTLPIPDGSASSNLGGSAVALRQGLTRSVRFILRESDFKEWPEIVSGFPAWTKSDVRRLEKAAGGRSLPRNWRCRAEPLSEAVWVSVESRGWSDKIWKKYDVTEGVIEIDSMTLGVQINGSIYHSKQYRLGGGSTGYSVGMIDRRDAA